MEYWQIALLTTLPVLVVALVFYLLINRFFEDENARRNYKLRKASSQEVLPQRLHAYERIALLLERIKPSSLAQRIKPQENKQAYELALIQSIQTEYDHNLSQQIYINPETWKIVYSTKNATQNYIRECSLVIGPDANAQALQEEILKRSAQEPSPSSQAMLYLQKDIQGI